MSEYKLHILYYTLKPLWYLKTIQLINRRKKDTGINSIYK